MKRNYVLSLLAGLTVICLFFMGISFFLKTDRGDGWNGLDAPRVVVSIEPQAFFVKKITQDIRVNIEILVPAGKEPETYVPSPDKIRNLARSDVYFRVGFPPEENFVPRLKSIAPKLLIVDTREGLEVRQSEGHHHHDDGSCCGLNGIDPHIWMSPAMVKKQADVILETLIDVFGAAYEESFRENHKKFIDELTDLQQTVQKKLDGISGKTLFVYHPSYGYFCDEFGLTQKAIEVEGKSPTPRKLADWIKTAKDERIQAIIIQPEFNQSAARTISEQTGVELIVHSPLEADYYQCVLSLAESIAKMYQD